MNITLKIAVAVLPLLSAPAAEQPDSATVVQRVVAIDNVTAWPNLTVLRDGTISATIFNQPAHGTAEGDVECWTSRDGQFWEKRGTAAPHDPGANRMNVAAGLAANGDLLVLAAGWSLKPSAKPGGAPLLVAPLRPWVSRSKDGGRTWNVDRQGFPAAETGMTEFVPFGDIVPGADGSLRAVCYTATRDSKLGYLARVNKVSMLRSDDDGRTWKVLSAISDHHNETALFHLGRGKWLAAARSHEAKPALDLFRSDDDGKAWRLDQRLTEPGQIPGDLLRMLDGRLLLSYGNRIAGQFGVAAKVSADDGATWSKPITVVSDLTSRDCGYPSSVQLPGGEILTGYYAQGVAGHQRYHMGAVLWKLPVAAASSEK
jgi:Neuraminidase (sialidase)